MSRKVFIFLVLIAYEISLASDKCTEVLTIDLQKIDSLNSNVEKIIFPQSCRDFQSSQDIVRKYKIQLDALDKMETGIGLSENFQKLYKLYEDNSKILENEFISCQKILYERCYQKNPSSSDLNKISSAFQELKKNILLRSPNPGANCFERAYLISKALADQGYASQITVINSPIILGKNLELKLP